MPSLERNGSNDILSLHLIQLQALSDQVNRKFYSKYVSSKQRIVLQISLISRSTEHIT